MADRIKKRKGIQIPTGQAPRAKDDTRFPETARLSAVAAIRRAMKRLADHG